MVQLVGIVNVTPDSFSDGGQYFGSEQAIRKTEELFRDGASLVDIGAESTRPNAQKLSDVEEWSRLEPVLQSLIPRYPNKISVDSYHSATIEKALAIGPIIINDVTGFRDASMAQLSIDAKATIIVSHLPLGMTIQEAHETTPIATVEQVKTELLAKADELEKAGVAHNSIILDPGIGFGKTPELNKELLRFAEQVPAYKVMIGYSRKRFLGEQRMDIEPNLTAGQVAMKHGAKYLRVHDVAGHKAVLALGE